MKIATAQVPVVGDPEVNGRAVRQAVEKAHQDGARLVQFTEGAVCGYAADPLVGDPALVRRGLRRTAALAGVLGIWVVGGAVHYLSPPYRPHNSLFVISDQGDLVGRYDKRLCSHTEITQRYSPGFESLVFEVDGVRFGCTLCVEINFPELFLDYRARQVDCVLFSSFSADPIFEILARGHAAAHNYWIAVSVPAHLSAAMPAGVIGPHGYRLTSGPSDGTPAVVTTALDRRDPTLNIALNRARPWRTQAREGRIYQARRVDDPRSLDRTRF